FWMLFYSLATYGNAGFLREQICKHMCPYARFQSAMLDKDTLIVTYDSQRGEPRGMRGKAQSTNSTTPSTASAPAQGDCIDCSLCVQVCPVGIDIRDGLQYECIGCGLCVDACDSVMDKVHLPRGLIRFATQNGMEQRWSKKQMLRRVLRPRVLTYSAITLAFCVALVISMAQRTPHKVNVLRDRASLARIVPGGQLENLYRLQIMNATEIPQTYRISASGLPDLTLPEEDREVRIDPTQSQLHLVRLRIPMGSASVGAHTVQFEVQASGATVVEASVFQVPR
ncbi:MAG: 4Fe-4S dicluster domain-containing protein, partial [Comamonas sp.]|nr:4Fe-4S dicluster domain-containing protein [Comamonas sp.]